MPTAGEEGYEKVVICPYDKAHEIRIGKMQFHLEKCRKNFPNAQLSECPFNNTHIVPTVELEYHVNEDCDSRIVWDRQNIDVGNSACPVKNLVPVNAATVPDGDENWDDFEAQGSVLNLIQTQAAEKNILRLKQCESKAKRKKFRQEERLRHEQLADNTSVNISSASSVTSNSGPLPKPKKQISVPVERQDPADFVATLNQQFRSLDLNIKRKDCNQAPSETSSMYNEHSSTVPSLVDSSGTPSQAPSVAESASTSQARSHALTRPSTSFSSALSTSSRMSTAASIAASVNRTSAAGRLPNAPNDEGFSQIPIPGLGRGRRSKVNNK